MIHSFKLSVIFFLLIFQSMDVWSQALFEEGVITYQVDTLHRVSPQPNAFRVRELRLYKKGNLYRLETIRNFTDDTIKAEKEVQIINEKGKFLFSGDSTLNVYLALFTSFDEKRDRKVNLVLKTYINTFIVEKITEQTTMLDMPVEKITLKEINNKAEKVEALIAKQVDTEFGFFFEGYRNIKGTALKFDDTAGEWLLRYTAVRIKNIKLSDDLFKVDPRNTIMSVEDMIDLVTPKR
jgi:hypothetical protein